MFSHLGKIWAEGKAQIFLRKIFWLSEGKFILLENEREKGASSPRRVLSGQAGEEFSEGKVFRKMLTEGDMCGGSRAGTL